MINAKRSPNYDPSNIRKTQTVSQNIQLVLLAVAVLEIKHFICDFVIQTAYQARNKGIYGHPGGILHSGLHAVTSAAVFLVIAPPLWVGVAIVFGEFMLHYHIDWTKEWVLRRMRWAHPNAQFWRTLGFDQLLHHLTYLGIVGVLAWVRGF